MKKYPKAFEEYYSKSHRDIGVLEPWQYYRLKNIMYLSWKAGARSQKLGDNY